jgi:uncharacterized protein (TIGR02611 family)
MSPQLHAIRSRIKSNRYSDYTYRALVLVIALCLFIAGVVMLVLPGPGLLVIALSLAVAATEFNWARKWAHSMRSRVETLRKRVHDKRNKSSQN